MNNGRLILVTGGARSGKSHFAEKLAEQSGKSIAYLATAQVLDAEMAERVALHQARRGPHWTTYDAAFLAKDRLIEAAQHHEIILFDCLTLHVTNLLLAAGAQADSSVLRQNLGELLQAIQCSGRTVIMVTNEVGSGIVPENALARQFRDWAGWANQMVADVADQVFLVICGQAVDVKKLAYAIQEGQ